MMDQIKVDPSLAIKLVNRGIGLTAFSINADGRKVPWTKDWSNVEKLPIQSEHDVNSCIKDGCHGFQIRPIDAGLAVLDIDIKEGKNGLESLQASCKLHGFSLSKLMGQGYIVKTPNSGFHIYLKPNTWLEGITEKGILEGIDLFCNKKGLVIIGGSIAIDKKTGLFKRYEELGHIDNAEIIPDNLSNMFQKIIKNREELKEVERQRKIEEIAKRQRERIVSFDGSIFKEANNRISTSLISTMFDAPGAFWKQCKNGMEFFTLNPLRQDNNVGSFSIRHDGIYKDFANDSYFGDFIDLLSQSHNMKPYDAARFIIEQTGGNPDDYKSKAPQNTIKISNNDPVSKITEVSKSDLLTEKDTFIDDDFEDDFLEPEQETKKVSQRDLMFPLARIGEMSLDEDEWIVDRLFQADSLALTYGKPGAGKSFWTLDLSLSIACGKAFHNNEVKQGPVVYLAGEGKKGILKRAMAWSKHYNIDVNTEPFFLAGRPFDLIDADSVRFVMDSIDYHCQGVKPLLVVIDTLARNFGDGDENKTSDMGSVIRNADAIRVKYGCLVIIVHHSGHDSDRARGSSALKAAMDFEYCVSQPDENILTVSNTRMKDGEKPADMNYKLTDIDLGLTHKWGEPIKSAVLIEEELDQNSNKKSKKLGKNQQLLVDILKDLYEEKRENLRKAFMNEDNARVTKGELSEKLKENGILKQTVYNLYKDCETKKLIIIENSDVLLCDFE